MAQFVEVPVGQLDDEVLHALLEEFASRDGTDYGIREYTLEEKIRQLRHQLDSAELCLLYDGDSAEWDLVNSDQARSLLLE